MDRRRFLQIATAAALAVPGPARAQGRPLRVAWLSGGGGYSAKEHRNTPQFRAFADGLREAGLGLDSAVQVNVHIAGPVGVEQYAPLAERLVTEGADVIVAVNPYSVAAVARATQTTPIVGLDFESDPVVRGWVTTLARPGRNLTGFFLNIPEIAGKYVQYLKEAKPTLSQVVVVGDAQVNTPQFEATEAAGRLVGLTTRRLVARAYADLDGLTEAAAPPATGLVVLTSPLVNATLKRIADTAVKQRVPAICGFVPGFAQAGGLMAYGPDFIDLYRRAAGYVALVLKGARPADLPVQRPEKFLLAVNLRTAKALGLTLPPSLLLRAEQVIE